MAFSYFRPFAIGAGATVLSPGAYAAQTWLSTGFQPGIADPASVNTVWRQGSFVIAGITQWMANTLNQDIHDDGNLNNFVTLFSESIIAGTSGGVTSFNTRTGVVTLTSTDVINALGYTPVRSLDGRTGQVVLNAADITSGLGYQPINKAGDTMSNALSGLTPTQPSHYVTKSYVDTSVAAGHSGAGNINGDATETNFPLGNGGLIKVGQFFPSGGLGISGSDYIINFETPFQTKCVAVKIVLVWENQNITRAMENENTYSGPLRTVGTATTIFFSTVPTYNLSGVQLAKTGFVMTGTDWIAEFGVFGFPLEFATGFTNPPGFIWTAYGF